MGDANTRIELIDTLTKINQRRALQRFPFSFRLFDFFPLTFDRLKEVYCSDNRTDQLRIYDTEWSNACRARFDAMSKNRLHAFIEQSTPIGFNLLSQEALKQRFGDWWNIWPASRLDKLAVYRHGGKANTMFNDVTVEHLRMLINGIYCLKVEMARLEYDVLYQIAFNFFDGLNSGVPCRTLQSKEETGKAEAYVEFMSELTRPRQRLVTLPERKGRK
jgi:hypothetical protein